MFQLLLEWQVDCLAILISNLLALGLTVLVNAYSLRVDSSRQRYFVVHTSHRSYHKYSIANKTNEKPNSIWKQASAVNGKSDSFLSFVSSDGS